MSEINLPGSNTALAPPTSSMTHVVSTVTLTPFFSPSPSATPSRLPPTLTPSPRPTFSPTEAYRLVEELLVTNGGCELPCWWGIQPGETSWVEAESFLETFAWQIRSDLPHKGITQYTAYFPLSDPPTWQESRGVRFDVNDDNIVMLIGTDMKHPLVELTQFGAPVEIWLLAYEVPLANKFEYELYLFYPSQGIIGIYSGYGDILTPNDQKQFFAFCQSTFNQSGYALWLWKPDTYKSVQQILSKNRDSGQLARYKLLTDVSSWDEKMFFANFSIPNATSCLEIPVDAFGQSQ